MFVKGFLGFTNVDCETRAPSDSCRNAVGMAGKRSIRGFALIYALLASVSFLVFFAALTFSLQGTLQTVRQSEDLLKARALAALGNDLVYQLIQNDLVDWRAGLPWVFSNEPGPDHFRGLPTDSPLLSELSVAELGGVFTVTLRDANTIAGFDPPDGGTYLVATCQARVGQRETTVNESSSMTIKLGVPFVNNLSVVSGTLVLHDATDLRGPIFIKESATGAPGRVDIMGHHTQFNFQLGMDQQVAHTAQVQGSIQSTGPIQIVNRDAAGNDIVALDLAGQYLNAGQQITVPPLFAPVGGTGIGGLEASGDLTLDPHFPASIRVSDIEEVFTDLSAVSGIIDIDLDTLGGSVPTHGVLVEVDDTNVRVHQVSRQFVGRLFDLALVYASLNPVDQMQGSMSSLYTTYEAAATQQASLALRECRWDDPAYKNRPIPENLRQAMVNLDIDGNGSPDVVAGDVPTEGDCLDYFRVEAGPLIESHTLSRGNWTIIRFRSSQRTCETQDGSLISPPVYIRGQVEGKMLMAYEMMGPDADQSTWVANSPPNRITVLAEDGNVPGGLTLKDPNVQLDPNSTGTFSEDQVLLMSNGAVNGDGLPAFMCRWLCGEPGGEQSLFDSPGLEDTKDWTIHRDLVADDLPIGHPDRELMDEGKSNRPIKFQGIAVSMRLGYETLSENFTGRQKDLEPEISVPSFTNGGDYLLLSWDEIVAAGIPVPDTSLAASTRQAVLPRGMRKASQVLFPSWQTQGAHAFLHGAYSGADPGLHQYDYRWRTMDAETLQQDLGLRVSPMLIERRGL